MVTDASPDAKCRGCRAAECDQQLPPSDGDCHTPLPREVRNGTIARHERAVFTFQEAGCWLLPLLLPPPALRERRHRGLAGRRVAVRQRAIFVLSEGEVDRAAAVLHDARATTAVGASYSGVNRSSTCKLNQTKYAPNASPIATLRS